MPRFLAKHNIASPAGYNPFCRVIPFLKYHVNHVTVGILPYVPLCLAIGGRAMDSFSLEYLSSCSSRSLEQVELLRLNEIANLRKELIRMMDELRMKEAEAILARMILNERAASPGARPALQTNFEFALLPPAPTPLAVQPKKREKKTA